MPTPRTVAASVVKATEKVVEAAAQKALASLAGRDDAPLVPGAPAPEPPSLAEPTEPQGPLPPKADQAGPDRRTATGAATDAAPADVAQQGAFLTTSQGLRLRDTDHSLKAGERGPTLLQDHHLREKITHFDHERIPERVVHARGAGAHGVFVGYGNAGRASAGPRSSAKGVDGRVRPVLDGAGLARFGGHRPRHPRVRHEVLHRRGHLRPGRQQHPGVLHPGRDQVPRRHPRRQAAPGPRDPPGAERPRHVLGLRLAAHRGPAPHDLEHVRPRHPALVPDHGGLRGAHVPARRRRRRHLAGQVPLEARARRALPDLGGGADARGDGSRLPPPRPGRRDRGRRVPPVGAGHPGLRGQPRADVPGHRPARPDQARARGGRAGAADRPADADGQPDELLRRDRAGRLPRRQPGAGHRRHRRPAAAGAAVLLRRHPADPAGRPELPPDPDQPAARAGQRHAARRLPPGRRARWRRAVPAELARRRLPLPRRAPTTARSSRPP